MAMRDVMNVMEPGVTYSVRDVCDALLDSGMRITSESTIANDMRKLFSRGCLKRVSVGLYLRPSTEDPELEVEQIRSEHMSSILSVIGDDV